MPRALVLLALLFGCGPRSGRTYPPEHAVRIIGAFTIDDVHFDVVAEKDVAVRNPCEPTFLRGSPCTHAEIRTALAVTSVGREVRVFAFDPGWTSADRIVLAERDYGAFGRIASRANDTFDALALVSCTSGRTSAFRVRHDARTVDIHWTYVSVFEGVAFGFVSARDTASCESALSESASFESRFSRALAEGDRRIFDAFVHGGALGAAFDFALAHPFAVDALREPVPLVDDVFFDALEVSLAADGALAEHLVRRLSDPRATLTEGLRRNDTLASFVAKLVARLPDGARTLLASTLAPLCAPSTTTCPTWRAEALRVAGAQR